MLTKIVVLCACMVTTLTASNMWVETSQNDFSDGIYERNLFASNNNNGRLEYVARFDLNGDGYIELFVSDRYGPYARLYWGSASGYSASNVTLFPTSGGANCDAADLNNDGYTDFLVTHYFEKLSIYWGTATGYDPNFRFDIPMIAYNRQEIFIADYNKDGYLDIATSQEQIYGHGAVFWGSASGFNINNRTDLPVIFGVHNMEVADLDHNGWLDLVFIEYYGSTYGSMKIYWGNENGFSPSNYISLTAPTGNHGLSVADLDNNSYLDLVTTGWYGDQSYIFWGSATGYSQSNRQVLNPGPCYGGSSIADLNNDGLLDIVYHRGGYGSAQQRIYWGSSSGYSDYNYQGFGYSLEASGGLIADLNQDGFLDIFTNTRTPTTQSYIFWGPGLSSASSIPSVQDHHGHFRQIGNVYSRAYYDDYISSVFDATEIADWDLIEWDADCPSGSNVLCWIRSGNAPVPDQTWSNWCQVNNGGTIPEALNAQYLQYKTRLSYANPCYLPALDEVRVYYNTTPVITATVRIEPRTINLKSQGKFTTFITLPAPYSHYDIDETTVEVEGAWAVTGHATTEHYIAKFQVSDLVGVTPGPAVLFTLHGQLFDGTHFCGTDIIRVIGGTIITDRVNNLFFYAITIALSTDENEAIIAKVYDINGKVIRDLGSIFPTGNSVTIIWDHCDNNRRRMPAGIYFIKANADQVQITEKFIIIK